MGALDLANLAGKSMADSKRILRLAQVESVEQLRHIPLRRSDMLADGVHKWAMGLAAAEGGATGLFGIFALPVDVPAVVTLALRTIHKIGICYGYEMLGEDDQHYIYAILSSSSANSIEEKAAALATFKQPSASFSSFIRSELLRISKTRSDIKIIFAKKRRFNRW